MPQEKRRAIPIAARLALLVTALYLVLGILLAEVSLRLHRNPVDRRPVALAPVEDVSITALDGVVLEAGSFAPNIPTENR